MTLLARRRFTLADQRNFAVLTGDVNPLHLDAAAARRALPGQVIVHGLHTVAWALDSYVAFCGGRWRPRRVTATFAKPAFLDEDVDVFVLDDADGVVQLRVQAGDVRLTDIRVRGGRGLPPAAGVSPAARRSGGRTSGRHAAGTPVVRTGADLPGLRGRVDVPAALDALAAMFPSLCPAVGEPALAGLLGVSTLVGMECPGLHSLLSGIDLRLDGDDTGAPGAMTYAVRRFAPSYRLVEMVLEAPAVTGTVLAFLRPAPVAQPMLAEVRAVVAPGEFRGQRALIVGGSRGLGELVAKIVAAGGGALAVTYRHGYDDARRLADELASADVRCAPVPFDVATAEACVAALDETLGDGEHHCWPPTHLYYFATPRIFERRGARFDAALFDRFSGYYVKGFEATVMACRERTAGDLRVLYPSTVAIDEAPVELAEYAAAKAAGEAVGRVLTRSVRGVRVDSVRLPRLPTDQTADVQGTVATDPLPVLVEVVRALHA